MKNWLMSSRMELNLKVANSLGDKPYLLRAFEKVDRKKFVPKNEALRAYDNTAMHIGFDQTISQPTLVMDMIDKLNVNKSDYILEIGAGSGYATAILSYLVTYVIGIEVVPLLAREAIRNIGSLRIGNADIVCGDGNLMKYKRMFDGILVSACAKEQPTHLLESLCAGGRLVAPVQSSDDQQRIFTYVKTSKGYEKRSGPLVRFVPLVYT